MVGKNIKNIETCQIFFPKNCGPVCRLWLSLAADQQKKDPEEETFPVQ
jgi:hypothetical protein